MGSDLKRNSTLSPWKRRKTTSSAILYATGVWGVWGLNIQLGVKKVIFEYPIRLISIVTTVFRKWREVDLNIEKPCSVWSYAKAPFYFWPHFDSKRIRFKWVQIFELSSDLCGSPLLKTRQIRSASGRFDELKFNLRTWNYLLLMWSQKLMPMKSWWIIFGEEVLKTRLCEPNVSSKN